MKNLAIISIVLLAISSCNTIRLTENWVKNHCVQSIRSNGKTHLECSNLYDTTKISSHLSEAQIEFDAVRGKIEVNVIPKDTTKNIFEVLKGIKIFSK